MLGDKLNTSRFTCSGPLIFGGGHPLQIPNVVIPAGSADIFRSYLGSTSIFNEPVKLQTLHLFPSQTGHLIWALCGAGKTTVIAFFTS